MPRRSRLLTASSVATIVLVLLLAIHPYLARAGTTAHTVTAHGNAQIDTAQSKFGGASGLFDGSGDYLSTPDSDDWNFGSGHFTIDFWLRFNSLPGSGGVMFIYSQRVDDNNRVSFFLYNDAGTYKWWFRAFSGGVNLIDVQKNAAALAVGTWYHVAVVRNGNDFMIFQDGTQCGTTVTDSDSIPDIAAALEIGAYASGASYGLNGWLDDYRTSKGIARWTSNFTPPTSAYTADSPTVLLLHMDGSDGSTTFVDDSAVSGPASYSFNVKASATQIVVTLTYSWSGSGSPPLGNITIAGPSGIPTLQESAAVTYDRTSISVSGSTTTYSVIHRATFTITAPGSTQTWTASISISGVSNYNVAIEVS